MCGCHTRAEFMLYSQKSPFCSRPVGITSSNGWRIFLWVAHRDRHPAKFISMECLMGSLRTAAKVEDLEYHVSILTSLSVRSHSRNHSLHMQPAPLPVNVVQLVVWQRGVQGVWLLHRALKLTHPHIVKRSQPRGRAGFLLCQPWSCNRLSEDSKGHRCR